MNPDFTITRKKLLSSPGLIASVGAPGAGKTTFFDKIDDPRWLRLERDRFRIALFGSKQAFWDHPLDVRHKSGIIRRSMKTALAVWPKCRFLLTDTGGSKDQISYFISAMDNKFAALRDRHHYHPSYRLPITLVVFEQPLEVLLERNRTRPEDDRVPEDIIVSGYDQLYGPEAWWRKYENRPATRTRTFILRPEQIIE